jgi:predicted nucleic acid-binding protein
VKANVVSEVMKFAPDPAVIAWVNKLARATLFVAAVTEAELLYGAALLAPGKRRDGLIPAIGFTFAQYFYGRVLPFDFAAAAAFAEIAESRRKAGRPIGQSDAQIAALARCEA